MPIIYRISRPDHEPITDVGSVEVIEVVSQPTVGGPT
jgi:hypothetical protein